jgi:CheY-like chemotaxis protein
VRGIKKILIVDDDEKVLQVMKDILEPGSYDVYTAQNGKDGLEQITRVEPDLVITDIVMPDMEGMEFISTLSKRKRGIPIIVMSGNVIGMKFLESARIFGAKATLTKPFKARELIEKINSILKE